MTATETPIWDFVLKFYKQQGVSESAIALQDSAGIDVNMILFLMWMAGHNRKLGAGEIRAVSDASHGWQNSVVVPIRNIRRLLKSDAPLVDNDTAQSYRKKVQALELEGEQTQLNAMAAMSKTVPSVAAAPDAAARDNLQAFAGVVGKTFPPTAVDTFVKALVATVNDK
jgi:uncharacterized protein (TIGR02444 family)